MNKQKILTSTLLVILTISMVSTTLTFVEAYSLQSFTISPDPSTMTLNIPGTYYFTLNATLPGNSGSKGTDVYLVPTAGTIATGITISYGSNPIQIPANGNSGSTSMTLTINSSAAPGAQPLTLTAYDNPGEGGTIVGMFTTTLHLNQYQLTVNSLYGNPYGAGWYLEGTQVAFGVTQTSVQISGVQYNFNGWSSSDAGGYSGADSSQTVTLNNSITETANWNPGGYQVNFTQSGSAVSPTVTYQGVANASPLQGTATVPFSIWVDPSSQITYSYEGTISGISETQYILNSTSPTSPQTVNGPMSVTSNYKTQYQVLFAVSPVGSGTTTPSVTSSWVDAGTMLSITASPNSDYSFSSWSSSTEAITFDNATSASSTATINEPGTITADFIENNSYALTVYTIGSGSVTPNNGTYHYGDSLTLTANAAAGWTFAGWTGDVVSSANSLVVIINGTTSVTANFAINAYAITITSGPNGSVTPGNQTVDWGTNVSLTIAPDVGYHVADVTVNGSSVGAVSSYNFSATGNTTISASFAINTYSITASAGAGGSISPSGTVNVNYGATPSFILTPNAGYYLSDLTVDSVSVLSQIVGNTYTVSAVNANHVIQASFAIDNTPTPTSTPTPSSSPTPTPTLSPTPSPTPSSTPTPSYTIKVTSAHGSPTQSASIEAGDSFTASVVSPEGDATHRWISTGYIIDGGILNQGTTYTFTNVQANHIITFNWQEQYYLKVSSPYGNPTGQGWYNAGSRATFAITQTVTDGTNTRYTFRTWIGTSTGAYTGPAITQTITMNNPTIETASWNTQYIVTYTTNGNSLKLTIPTSEWINSGAAAKGTFPTTITNPANTTQYIFISDDRPATITQPTLITATYQTQYLVTYATNGNVLPVTVPAPQWTNAGTAPTGTFQTQITNTASNTRCNLLSDNRPPVITNPITITANYQTQYTLTFTQTGLDSDAKGTVLTVLGNAKNYKQLADITWVNSGSYATFRFNDKVASTTADKQYTLTNANATSPLTIDVPIVIQGNYRPLFSNSLFTVAEVALILFALLLLLLFLLAWRRRRKKKNEEQATPSPFQMRNPEG